MTRADVLRGAGLIAVGVGMGMSSTGFLGLLGVLTAMGGLAYQLEMLKK